MSLAATLQSRFFRWALRGDQPEAAPVLLTRKRVYVLPTRFGLSYCLLLLIMLVAAVNYDLGLAYAQVFLLAGLGVVCIFHSFRNLAQLSIQPGRAPPVFAGDEAHFSVILDSDRPRPALSLNLPGQRAVEDDVPAGGSCEFILKLPAKTRGWLAMPRLRISTTYPLGLIRAWAYAAPEARCLVYPAPYGDPPPPSATADADSSKDAGSGAGLEDFSGLRLHHPADPLRHVAWKAAARSEQGPLLTKLFNGGEARNVWLDFDALPAGSEVETRLSMLTRGVCDAAAAGVSWGLRLPGASLGPDKGEDHYAVCLRTLALFGQAAA